MTRRSIWLMLRRLKVSEAAAKIAISRDARRNARSRPARVRDERGVANARRHLNPAKTSAASAICGTHFGETNADTSITRWPADVRRSMKATLSRWDVRFLVLQAVARPDFDDRDATGRVVIMSISTSRRPGCTSRPDCRESCATMPSRARAHGQFHFHGLENQDRIALVHVTFDLHKHLHDRRRHRRAHVV